MQDWGQKKSVWCYELQLREVHVTRIWDQAPKRNHQAPAGEESSLVILVTSTATTKTGMALQRGDWFLLPLDPLLGCGLSIPPSFGTQCHSTTKWEISEHRGFIDLLPAYFISMTWLKTATTWTLALQNTPSFLKPQETLVQVETLPLSVVGGFSLFQIFQVTSIEQNFFFSFSDSLSTRMPFLILSCFLFSWA